MLHGTIETYFHEGPREPLLRREVESLRPPSPEVICCLAVILGESQDSRLNPGVDREAKLAIISASPERFQGESLEDVTDSRTGLIMGDLFTGIASHEGRRVGLGLVNVGFQAFHEGRGVGKNRPPWGVID